MWFARSESIGRDPHRPDQLRIGVPEAIYPPVTDPHDRSDPSIDQLYVIANLQRFDRDLTLIGRDARAGDEAGQRAVHRDQRADACVRRDPERNIRVSTRQSLLIQGATLGDCQETGAGVQRRRPAAAESQAR